MTEAALAHLTLDDLLDELLLRVRAILEVDTVAVLLLDTDTDELVARAAKGLEEEVEAGVRVPLGRGFAGRVAAQRRAVVIEDLSKADVVNPILRQKGIVSMLGVPLIVEGEVLGVLHVGSLVKRLFDESDAELLQLAADRMALALDRARTYEAERDARMVAERAAAQVRQLQSITDVALGSVSLDDGLLNGLLSRIREVLHVDTTAILLLDPEGKELVARAAKGLEEEVSHGVRIPVGRGFAGRVAAERRPVVVDDVEHAEILNPILREKGVRSLLGVPLLVEGRALGVLHIGTLTPRDFTPDEVALLELAADRVAIAVDRARQQSVAETLQRSLLPDRLPDVAGLSLAARYMPGVDDAHVGGDWYDVLQLPGGRTGFVMGDVVSRGVRAAASMGQLRTALRAYALEGGEPGGVLDRLDRLVRGMGGREMATVAYAVLDPASGELRYALAAHPPPLVVGTDGGARFLDGVRSGPVGVASGLGYEVATAKLEPGDALVLYTDGLVERRDEGLDEGLDRLVAAAAEGADDPDELCSRLVARLGAGSDDVALLAVTLDPVPATELRLQVDATPASLSVMRRSLREWLTARGAGDSEAYDVLLAAGEAAANAVEHAYGPGDAEFKLIARAEDGRIALTIADRGNWRPPRGQNRGRGLALMRQLMDDVEVEQTAGGTSVTMRRALGERG